MVLLLALATGVLFAAGIYLVLKRTVVQLIIGLALLGHAANLFLFSMGGMRPGSVPIIGAGSASSMVDPVPQALILTAIVIGFGMQAFVLVLSYRAHEESGSDNLEEIESTDAV
jgi:multicomponent Na+:H+ antiporter subunit C